MKTYFLSQAPALGGAWPAGLLVLRLLVAAFFVLMAAKNLSGSPEIAADFQRWGYTDGFRRLTAVLQIVGAFALVLPWTCFLGAGILACILAGAAVTHVVHDPPQAVLSPVVFLALVAVVLVFYRPLALR